MSQPQDHPSLVALATVVRELAQMATLAGLGNSALHLSHVAQAQIEALRDDLDAKKAEDDKPADQDASPCR